MLLASVLLPGPRQRMAPARSAARCVRSPLLRGQWICGRKVVWVNPDGTRVVIGNSSDLFPMPRPLPWTRSWRN